MKKTGKIVAVVLCLAAVLMLAACGGGSAPEELAGKWSLTSAEAMGEIVTMEQMAEMGMSFSMDVDFKDAKKVEVTADMDGTTETGSSNYTYENGVVTITDPDGTTVTLTLVDGVLQYDVGTAVLLLERQ